MSNYSYNFVKFTLVFYANRSYIENAKEAIAEAETLQDSNSEDEKISALANHAESLLDEAQAGINKMECFSVLLDPSTDTEYLKSKKLLKDEIQVQLTKVTELKTRLCIILEKYRRHPAFYEANAQDSATPTDISVQTQKQELVRMIKTFTNMLTAVFQHFSNANEYFDRIIQVDFSEDPDVSLLRTLEADFIRGVNAFYEMQKITDIMKKDLRTIENKIADSPITASKIQHSLLETLNENKEAFLNYLEKMEALTNKQIQATTTVATLQMLSFEIEEKKQFTK